MTLNCYDIGLVCKTVLMVYQKLNSTTCKQCRNDNYCQHVENRLCTPTTVCFVVCRCCCCCLINVDY